MPKSAEFSLEEIIRLLRNNQSVFAEALGVGISADIGWKLMFDGRIYAASDADQDDRVTGQLTFSATTPTFILHNPADSEVICIPSYYHLAQTGTVAGGVVQVETECRNTSAYSSGGVEEGVSSLAFGHSSPVAPKCKVYSNPTGAAGYTRAVGHVRLAADVEPAEGIINIYEWQPPAGLCLYPGASMQIYTYGASPGPTWGWHIPWAEFPLAWIG